MKIDMILNSCVLYKNDNGEEKTLLICKYKSSEYCQSSAKFKGYADQKFFYDGNKVFNLLKKEYFGVPVDVMIEERSRADNPLKKEPIIKSFKFNNELVNLL